MNFVSGIQRQIHVGQPAGVWVGDPQRILQAVDEVAQFADTQNTQKEHQSPSVVDVSEYHRRSRGHALTRSASLAHFL